MAHSLVTHGYTVTHAYHIELQRGATGDANSRSYSLADLIEMHVARYKLVVGVDHADEGAVQFLRC